MMSSIVGTGSSHLAVAGWGLISQQRPVNLPYSCRSLHRGEQSDWVGFLDKEKYCFLGGNMSSTACQESGVFTFRFFQLHSTSVLLRLWMPWMKSATTWLKTGHYLLNSFEYSILQPLDKMWSWITNVLMYLNSKDDLIWNYQNVHLQSIACGCKCEEAV